MEMNRRAFTLAAAATVATAAAPLHAKTKAKSRIDDVLILGAGISGLGAARHLEAQGLKVTVLEGRNRVGGRIHTRFDLTGHPEFGFNTMGDGYGRGIEMAEWAGVELWNIRDNIIKPTPTELWMNGRKFSREEWAASPLNPFPAADKKLLPWEFLDTMVSRHNRLKDWAAWLEPQNAHLDISVHAFLREQGLSDAAIQLASDFNTYYGNNSHDASALMLEYSNGFVATQIAAGSRALSVKGGNGNLPIAIARKLKGPVLLGKEVVAIDLQPDVCEVRCEDGSVYRAKRVVSSLPFSTLRQVRITPVLEGKQDRAVKTLGYQPITLAYIESSAPFWEEDGHSTAMWHDGFIGAIYPQRYGTKPDEITGLLVMARGILARQWDRMGEEAASRKLIAEMEALRPAAKGKMKVTGYHSWAQEYFNNGDFSFFGPGQIADFVPTMSAPHGRLHFCGEHTAVAARGLESALESSERVALEVLTA